MRVAGYVSWFLSLIELFLIYRLVSRYMNIATDPIEVFHMHATPVDRDKAKVHGHTMIFMFVLGCLFFYTNWIS